MEFPWMLAASTALVIVAQGVLAGRRRSGLNRALHELRRPLQALALSVPSSGPAAAPAAGSLRMASAALARLDREINGGRPTAALAPVPLEPLVCGAVERWGGRAALAGATLELRWRAAGAVVVGDRWELARALDNLVENALLHGRPAIVLEARREGEAVRLLVVDSGAPRRPRARRREPALVRVSGRGRHGHGLAVVRDVAGEHGGSFELRRTPSCTVASISLPLLRTARRAF